MEKYFTDIENAPKAVGPYSIAAKTDSFTFCSGQIPIDTSTGKIVEGGIEAQTRQVIANIEAVLKGIAATKQKIVKTTVFLTDLGNFQIFNGIYAEWLGDHKPARSTIQVAALPLGSTVEIECIVAA